MGLGVVGPLGESPSDKWRLRISLIDSRRLQRVAAALLSGHRVVASDNRVQISWTCDGTFRCILRLRDANPTTEFLLDVIVEALQQDDVDQLHSPDPAGVASPLPDAWMTLVSETAVTWELFNCRVDALRIEFAR